MSKLSTLNDVIEKLESAEDALLKARHAFEKQSRQYGIIDRQWENVSDAVEIIKNVLRFVEEEKINSEKITGGWYCPNGHLNPPDDDLPFCLTCKLPRPI